MVDNLEYMSQSAETHQPELQPLYAFMDRTLSKESRTLIGIASYLAPQEIPQSLFDTSYNYDTTNQHETALLWFEKSRLTWIAWNVKCRRPADWPTVTKKNMGRCFVYLNRFDEAQDMLDTAISEFLAEKSLNWTMLAHTYVVFGILSRRKNQLEAAEANFMEAEDFWFRGKNSRLHPFITGCGYKLGVTCLDQGKIEIDIKRAIEITKQHARVLFRLSEALGRNTHDEAEEVDNLKDAAKTYLLRKDPSAPGFSREEDYDQWMPIFWLEEKHTQGLTFGCVYKTLCQPPRRLYYSVIKLRSNFSRAFERAFS